MLRIMEKVVNVFSRILFDGIDSRDNDTKEKKEQYVLSSIFPNTKIMKEVEKHI